ncbi:FAD-dependent monooxygenase [Nonomuraea sp. NPDC050556]|uniref:FAD-dependent monooxygenase n=1 Tax=Nonomuraea sp. NPDC050556 TaxID=3364369 RepID=UPI00379A7D9A
MEYDVIVAGAGPVGLMLAIELRLGGVSVLVLERAAEPYTELKAGFMGARSINAPSTVTLHKHGLLDAVRQAALWWYTPGDEIPAGAFIGHFAGLNLSPEHLDPAMEAPPHGGGAIAMLDLETILAERLAELGGQIRRGVTVDAYAETPSGVLVNGVHAARWLVGCDGGRSTVRKLAGIAFPGNDGEYTGRVALTEISGDLPMGGWTRTATGSYVHGPIPGRIHTVEYGEPVDRDAPLTPEEMTASLRRVTGLDVEVTKVHIGTRYTDATRQAATYRHGRVLLAGDAAHIHSPAGGQGLNLGIGDASCLGPKLAAVARGEAVPDLLDTYTAERHPLGAWVQAWSDAQTALSRPDVRTEALRGVMRDLLDTTDGATYVLRQISGL